MVVDFHTHCFPDDLAGKAIPALAEEAGVPARLNGTVADLKKSMKKAGIDYSVILSIATKPAQTGKISEWSAKIQDDGIIAFGSIHPDSDDWRYELERMKELGLKGIKFHPDYQNFYVDEAGMFPKYEFALELGFIIVFHAGVDIGLPKPYHCTPDRLLKIAKAFPGGKIIAAHMGGYLYWDEVEKHLVGEDIYFDTSYCLDWIGDERARRIIGLHGYEKILFATDSPWTDQAGEIEKIRRLGLGGREEQAILWGNAAKLMPGCI